MDILYEDRSYKLDGGLTVKVELTRFKRVFHLILEKDRDRYIDLSIEELNAINSLVHNAERE